MFGKGGKRENGWRNWWDATSTRYEDAFLSNLFFKVNSSGGLC